MNRLAEKALAGFVAAATLAAIGAGVVTLMKRSKDGGLIAGADAFEAVGAVYERDEFANLPGWVLDKTDDALPAFLRSCERISNSAAGANFSLVDAGLAGAAADWSEACEAGARVSGQPYADSNARTSAVRTFFEYYFRPVKVSARLAAKKDGPAAGAPPHEDPLGRFTGYFEPFYEASPERTPVFSTPVYARPDDLISVDLGRFRPELAGQRIAGKLKDGVLEPYPDRAEINQGALVGKTRALAWMRPSDSFFLQIQGSGRLSLPDGELRVGYDGANGQPYTAIGRTLIDKGALTRDNVSMQTIRGWLDSATDADARAVRESNRSFVFFRVLDALPDNELGPLGAEGVQLTPGRSLAVDPRYVPYGAPVWISIDARPDQGKFPVRRLLVAQDTGGAIKGAVRGDIFVGSGPLAGDVAGDFNELGEFYVLLPKALAEKLPAAGAR
ncbi:MAG: MltA domain-containing protein [Parvularculaceae bacterium]